MDPVRDITHAANQKAVTSALKRGSNSKLTWHGCGPVRGKMPRLKSGSSVDYSFQASRTSNGIATCL